MAVASRIDYFVILSATKFISYASSFYEQFECKTGNAVTRVAKMTRGALCSLRHLASHGYVTDSYSFSSSGLIISARPRKMVF